MTGRYIALTTGLGRLRITWPADTLTWEDGRWVEQYTSPSAASLDWKPIPADYAIAILAALIRREPLPAGLPS